MEKRKSPRSRRQKNCFSVLRKRPRPCENSIGPQLVIALLFYVCMIRGLIQEIVVKFSREFGKRRIRIRKRGGFWHFGAPSGGVLSQRLSERASCCTRAPLS